MKKLHVWSLAVMVFASALCLAQDAPKAGAPGGAAGGGDGGGRGGRGGPGGGGRNFDPAAMAKFMQERIGATPEEWTVIQPRLQVVMEKNQALRELSGNRFGRGGRGGPGGAAAPADPAELAAVNKAIEGKDPAAIKTALEAFRKVRTTREDDLKKAKTALREVLSVSQEARLVAMGILD